MESNETASRDVSREGLSDIVVIGVVALAIFAGLMLGITITGKALEFFVKGLVSTL